MPIVSPFCNQHDIELRNIVVYVQILGLVYGYLLLDIDLRADAEVKQSSWKTEDNFK